MRTNNDCDELLYIFARSLDTMVVGLGILALLWFFSRRQKAAVLPVLKLHKSVNTKRLPRGYNFFTEKNHKKVKWKSEANSEENQLQQVSATAQKKTKDQHTQTISQDIKKEKEYSIWKGVWVDEDEDAGSNVSSRHKTELLLDFSSGKVTRSEQVFRTQHSHVIAPL